MDESLKDSVEERFDPVLCTSLGSVFNDVIGHIGESDRVVRGSTFPSVLSTEVSRLKSSSELYESLQVPKRLGYTRSGRKRD